MTEYRHTCISGSSWFFTVNLVERKIVTDWHANFRLPVQLIEDGCKTTISYDGYGKVM
ncbi:MAG: hypothetical protein KDE66_02020 [Nitrosomonas sp.]|nr:hypothetical protein [Nitrosomonas sp.]